MTILSIIIVYYSLLIVTKVVWLRKYSTSDLRYYLASDRYSTTNINRILHYMGIVLVAAITGYGITLLQEIGNTSSMGTLLSFLAVNCSALYAGTICHYVALQNLPLDHDIFKHAVGFKLLDKQSFLSKITRSHYDVIDCVVRGVCALLGITCASL